MIRPLATIYVLSGITGINHHREQVMLQSLSNNKYRVVVIHPRGTGYSEGRRGDIKDFSRFLQDYEELINRDALSENNGNKTILFGHSMSAAVVLHVAEKINRVDGVILINPPVKLKAAPGLSPSLGDYFKYAFYYLFAPHRPVVNMAGDPSLIADDAERKEAEERGNDPLLVKYFSLRMMSDARKMMNGMVNKGQTAAYPLLLVYGQKDNIVDKSGCDDLFAAWLSPHKQYEIIENGPHGALTVQMSMAAIQRWMDDLSMGGPGEVHQQ